MNISPISQNKQNFQHLGKSHGENSYSKKERAVITGMTVLGTAASCALLAKKSGYSLNPAKMLKNIKKSFLANVKFHDKEVITIGAGSCIGGLAGGYMVDKNPENRKAKRRETVMQLGNISIPIITVETFAKFGKKFGKLAQATSAIAGIFTGVYVANILMNKLGNLLFRNKNERGVKATDFSAHVDDMVVAASYISVNKYVHSIARIVPLALMIPGYEVGTKKVH